MDQLLALIGLMYDAAMDPALWGDVLAKIALFLRAVQSALVIEDAANPAASAFYTSFSDPEWVARYVQTFMLINPMRLAMVGDAKDGDVILTTDFMTPEDYGRTPFARDWLAQRGVIDIAAAVLEKTTTSITVLSIHRSAAQGFADDLLRVKLGWLVPHAQRAVRIGQLFEHKSLQAATLVATLDGLAAAVFLVNAAGTIVHANTAAAEILHDSDLLQRGEHRLQFADKAAAAALARALDAMAGGDAALATESRAIPITTPRGTRYTATVVPLLAGRRLPIAAASRAVAAVCIKEAAFAVPGTASTLAAHHELTRREMAILVAVVELGGVPAVAAALGLSEATVKSHLKSIHRKTGARRQADLVKLVAGTAVPFRTPRS